MSAPSSSSVLSSSPARLLLALVGGAGAVAAAGAAACHLRRQSNRTNAKLNFTLEQQIESLKAIYPRLCSEFIADVSEQYAFPAFALERLQRMFDYTILGGKYYRATLVLNTLQELCKESGKDIETVWEGGLVLGWCIEIVRTNRQTAAEAQCAREPSRAQWSSCVGPRSESA